MAPTDPVFPTPNRTMVSLNADLTPFDKKDTPSITGPEDPHLAITAAPLTKFQKFCLKCEPLMLYVVSMAQFLDIVNGASMTVAMLPIARDLHFEAQQQQWLISSYAVSFGGLLLVAGRMGDLFGHRRVFLSGLFWFGLWSMVNGFSKTPEMLCISRALQGMGAAAQIPTALALIAIKYPAGKPRTRALSVFGAVGGMGAVTGLLLSGALTSSIGWQWIFYISAIMSAILFVFGVFAIPDARGYHGESPRIDFGGAATATAGIVCVIYYISSGVETGWASAKTLPVLCAGIVFFVAFIMIEKRISNPIMPFHVWKHRTFSTTIALIFIMQGSFQGFLYFNTLIFQEVMGYSIMKTSVSFLAHGLCGIVTYTVLGMFLPRLPLKPFIALGFLLLGSSSLIIAFVTPTTTYWGLPFCALIVNVFGLGMIMLPGQVAALRDAADDDQGVVGAIYNVGIQIGSPFGLAILTVISGKLNGETVGPAMMYGYKYALIGGASYAYLGCVLTLVFLPDIRPAVTKKNRSLEEGGAAANNQDSMAEKDMIAEKQGFSQEQGLEESNVTIEDVLQNPRVIEEEIMTVAKVQFA